MNVKVNDNVVVLAGKCKGKQGKVVAVSPKTNRVTVEGINIQHRHEKARSAQDTSKISEVEGAIDASNVMLICPACGKATRIGHKTVDGKSVRVCIQEGCGAVIDKAYSKRRKTAEAPKAEEQAPKKRVRKRTAKVEEAVAETAEDNKD